MIVNIVFIHVFVAWKMLYKVQNGFRKPDRVGVTKKINFMLKKHCGLKKQLVLKRDTLIKLNSTHINTIKGGVKFSKFCDTGVDACWETNAC